MANNREWLGAPHDSAAFIKLATQTASSSATLEFTDFIDDALYGSYLFIASDLRVSVNNASLAVRLSSDGGSTWRTGSTDYVTQRQYGYGSNIGAVAHTVAHFLIGTGSAVSLGHEINADMRFTNMSNAASLTKILGPMSAIDASGNHLNELVSCYSNVAAADNAVQFFPQTSGVFTSGTITLFGIPK